MKRIAVGFGVEGCQASAHSSGLCFNICKCDTTGYLKEDIGDSGALSL